MSGISLTAIERQTLASLSQVTALQARTQERLNTGKKVNSASDDAVAYFRSQSLYNRSTAILGYKTGIDQSVQTINAALTGTSAVETLLDQLQGILTDARTGTANERASATTQFQNIAQQLSELVKDTTYQGLNILTSSSASLSTQFSERTAATFTIKGYNLIDAIAGGDRSLFTQSTPVFKADGTLVFSQLVNDGSAATGVAGFSALDISASAGSAIPGSQATAIFTFTATVIDNAISQLQAVSSSLGVNVAILSARSDFSTAYSNTLQDGGDKLTLADLNTEAANSQALSLRQQLGIQSLTISATQASSILTLLKAGQTNNGGS